MPEPYFNRNLPAPRVYICWYGYDKEGNITEPTEEMERYPIYIKGFRSSALELYVDDGTGTLLKWNQILDWPDMWAYIGLHFQDFMTQREEESFRKYREIRDTYYLHHHSKCNYAPRRGQGFLIEPYSGKWGNGYTVVIPRHDGSYAGYREYWIKKEEDGD